MSSRRRSNGTGHLERGRDHREAARAIAACFLIRFDKRVGYSIAWSRAVQGLELDGVEFKSLPSGLHNIQEDLTYFTHSDHIGLSIYRQTATSEDDRNASFLALGILVPRGSDPLGGIWRHADGLRTLAGTLSGVSGGTRPLEEYWELHNSGRAKEASQAGPRSSSGFSSDEPTSFDPRQSFSSVLDSLGPLVFPIWRAALLRERIIFMKQPPLRKLCEMVYALSTFASIPHKATRQMSSSTASHITPIFSLGVHDIPELDEDANQASSGEPVRPVKNSECHTIAAGWIACSSDKLLETKSTLSDLQIAMPEANGSNAAPERWPQVTKADGSSLQATQRDLRRYIALRQSLKSFRKEDAVEENDGGYEAISDHASLLRGQKPHSLDVDVPNEGKIVEPQSWALMVYDGYMWWASAGERALELQDEYDNDADLHLDSTDGQDDRQTYSRRKSISERPGTPSASFNSVASILTAYFHHLTVQLMSVLTALDRAAEAEQNVTVSKDDLTAMGLDPWSPHDRQWVAKMVKLYYYREAEVEGASIECCGVKLY